MSIRRSGLLAVLLAVIAAGCAAPASPTEDVLVSNLDQVDDSAITAPTTFVVRDAATLRRVWNLLFDGRPRRDLPPLDFSRHMLVIVAIGTQPTAGYRVRITGAERTRRGILVHVSVLRPADDCQVAQVRTNPIAMARLPQRDVRVGFDYTRGIAPCR